MRGYWLSAGKNVGGGGEDNRPFFQNIRLLCLLFFLLFFENFRGQAPFRGEVVLGAAPLPPCSRKPRRAIMCTMEVNSTSAAIMSTARSYHEFSGKAYHDIRKESYLQNDTFWKLYFTEYRMQEDQRRPRNVYCYPMT